MSDHIAPRTSPGALQHLTKDAGTVQASPRDHIHGAVVAGRILIMGAAGRDFHDFNTYYRNNRDFEVVFAYSDLPHPEVVLEMGIGRSR